MWSFGNIGVTKRRRAIKSRERLLTVSISANEISILEATRSGRSVTCLSSFRWTIPDALLGPTGKLKAELVAVGHWLRQKLDSHGITTRQSMLVLPRQTAMLKLIDLPEVPDDELESLVLLQAESRLARPMNELCCDFLKLPNSPSVLLVSVPRSVLESQGSILKGAGLEVLSATVGELNLIHRDPDNLVSGTQLGVISTDEQAELILSRDGIPMTTIAVRMSGELNRDRRSLASTITRLIASLPDSLGGAPICCIATFGTNAAQLVPNGESIEQPQAIVIQGGVYAKDTGHPIEPSLSMSLLSRAISCDSLDLLNPRRPPDPQAMSRRRVWRWIAAAAAMVGAGALFAYEHSRILTTEIDQLKRRDAESAKLIERGQSLLDAASFVDDWRQGQVDWPRNVAHFIRQMPTRERAYLTRLTLEMPPHSSTPRIRASGLARETDDVLHLYKNLITEKAGYALQPHAIEPNPRDTLFKVRFDIDATAKLREANSATPPLEQ